MRRAGWLAGLCLLCLACGEDETGAPPTSAGASSSGDPSAACPEIGTPGPSPGTCVARVPPEPCAPGSMAVAGETTCRSVGWTDCPDGFELGASGWSCRAVLPSAPCLGATRPALGATGCVPVGDCAAAFPPADATLFVDAGFDDAQLDATHVRTIGEAMAASVGGDVIAVAPGDYPEPISATEDVTIVGRCPAEVRVSEPGGTGPGLLLQSASTEITVRGLTIAGHRGGVVAIAGRLTLEDVVLDAPRELGLTVIGDAEVTVRRAVIRGAVPADMGALGRGIDAEEGAQLTLEDVAVVGNTEVGIYVQSAGTHVDAARVVVLETQPAARKGGGRGLYVKEGATFTGSALALVANHDVGVYAIDEGTTVTLKDAFVADTRSVAGALGEGLSIDEGARLDGERVTLLGNREGAFSSHAGTITLAEATVEGTLPSDDGSYGGGFNADDGAVVTLERTAVVDNVDVGAGIIGASLKVTDVLVTRADDTPLTAYGIGVAVFQGQLEAERLTIVRAETAGLMLSDAVATGTHLLLSQSRAKQADGSMGYGLAVLGGAHIDVAASIVAGSASVGMLFAGGSATVRGSFIQENTIGVYAQDGSTLLEGDSADPANPTAVVVGGDCIFVDNGARVGSGSPLPLPDLGP